MQRCEQWWEYSSYSPVQEIQPRCWLQDIVPAHVFDGPFCMVVCEKTRRQAHFTEKKASSQIQFAHAFAAHGLSHLLMLQGNWTRCFAVTYMGLPTYRTQRGRWSLPNLERGVSMARFSGHHGVRRLWWLHPNCSQERDSYSNMYEWN